MNNKIKARTKADAAFTKVWNSVRKSELKTVTKPTVVDLRMGKEKNIARLASFMGWKMVQNERDTPYWFVRKDGGSHIVWDPFEYLSDAMMIAEKIGCLSLCQMRPGEGWSANFDEDCSEQLMGRAPAGKASEAITLAALCYLDASENRSSI